MLKVYVVDLHDCVKIQGYTLTGDKAAEYHTIICPSFEEESPRCE